MQASFWDGEEARRLELEVQVEKALLSIDKEIRREYDMAVEVFPQLVRKETRHVDFLRIEGGDPIRAATRLSMYWKYRKQLFNERWLLPMTQTGTGALSMDEVQLLRSGYSVCFQRPGQGMLVVHDHSRMQVFDGLLHAKNIMYYSTIMTDEATQVNGMSLVFVIKSGERPSEDFKRESWDMIQTALPIKASQILVVQAYEEGREHLLGFLAYQTKRTLEVRARHAPEQLMANSARGTRALLEERGIHRQYLPQCLGGDYTYDQFADWIRMRISIEDIMSPAPMKSNKLSPKLLCNSTGVSSVLPAAKDKNSQAVTVVTKKKTARKRAKAPKPPFVNEETRKMNAMYARRAYHKRKLEILGLEQQVGLLKSDNERLGMESKRLEGLLGKAKEIMAGQPGHGALPPRMMSGRQAPPQHLLTLPAITAHAGTVWN